MNEMGRMVRTAVTSGPVRIRQALFRWRSGRTASKPDHSGALLMTSITERFVDRHRDRFVGRLITPSDTDFDPARAVWNGDIDRYPAVIPRCAGSADVAEAIRFARESGLEISVRGG